MAFRSGHAKPENYLFYDFLTFHLLNDHYVKWEINWYKKKMEDLP